MTAALEMTTTGSGASWEEAYEELAYTAFALRTQADDPQIAKLHTEVVGVLGDWEHIEADRRRLRATAIAARANVRVADAALDLALRKIAETILEETDGDADADLYTRFFPEPHERVIALGLDAELPIASAAMAQLDEGEAVPDALKAHIDPLRSCLTVGNAAITGRADAYAGLGRLQARIEAWMETADATARNVHSDLTALGDARGLSYRWTSSFFAR